MALIEVRDKARVRRLPADELAGSGAQVGSEVSKLAVGDIAGVGRMVDSCRACGPCDEGLEQFCEKGNAPSYNGTEMDRKTLTYGGYSTQVVVDERYTLRISKGLEVREEARCDGQGARAMSRIGALNVPMRWVARLPVTVSGE